LTNHSQIPRTSRATADRPFLPHIHGGCGLATAKSGREKRDSASRTRATGTNQGRRAAGSCLLSVANSVPLPHDCKAQDTPVALVGWLRVVLSRYATSHSLPCAPYLPRFLSHHAYNPILPSPHLNITTAVSPPLHRLTPFLDTSYPSRAHQSRESRNAHRVCP